MGYPFKRLLQNIFNTKAKHLLHETMLIEQQSSLGTVSPTDMKGLYQWIQESLGWKEALWAQYSLQYFSNIPTPALKKM